MTRESNTASPPSITRQGTLPERIRRQDRIAVPDVFLRELIVQLLLGHDDAHLRTYGLLTEPMSFMGRAGRFPVRWRRSVSF